MKLSKFGNIVGMVAGLSMAWVCSLHADTDKKPTGPEPEPRPFEPPPTLPYPVDKGPIKGSFVDYDDATRHLSVQQTRTQITISETGKPTLIFDKPGLDEREQEVLWDESGLENVYRGKDFLDLKHYVVDQDYPSVKAIDYTVNYVFLSNGLLDVDQEGPQGGFAYHRYSPEK
jgi:hypothetical protein